MKKIILVLLTLMGLSACSKAGGSKGVVECSLIRFSSYGTQNLMPGTESSKVYEFKNSKDETIYLSECYYDELKVISYKKENSIYTYSRLVGYISLETSYYLHLESKTVEARTKYVEYKETETPDGGDPNAKEAYKCAKKRFISSDYVYDSTVYIDDVDFSLERKYFIKLGENSLITYVPKD